MARPRRPVRNILARSWCADVRRFLRLINTDEVFGTHSPPKNPPVITGYDGRRVRNAHNRPQMPIRPNVADGSRPCENSNARRARRNILDKLRFIRTHNTADIRLDAMLENYIFYISRM